MSNSRVTNEQRQIIAERANNLCEYCHIPADFATQSFAVEHIYPQSLGGPTELNNLALACPGCNSHKQATIERHDIVSGQIVPLFHPRRDKWSTHFGWNEDFTLIIGLTPVGRVTVTALQMNRTGLVNLRKALYLFGKHPPINDMK
ncbi:MAG TPA: HNH endonuclease [Anaerolineae bacterium]|nr:HNH endonuclease [Anaerolineae bacterium]